jgi:hypothetical protein
VPAFEHGSGLGGQVFGGSPLVRSDGLDPCAIVAGERDPYPRAELCASRVHSTRQPVAQSLEGNWRTEWLFVVQQNLYR